MTEQQSYSSSTHFSNAKVKSYCIMIILCYRNEQSSEGTEESRDLDIATVKSVNVLSDILILLILKLIFSRLNGCSYGRRFLCLPSFQILATPL